MIIAIDGPRSAGKSELIQLLSERFQQEGISFVVKKELRGSGNITQDILNLIKAANEDEITIFDRFHLTELVYSTIWKRRPRHELVQDNRQIESELAMRDVLSIVLLPSPDILDRRTEKRTDKKQDVPGYEAYDVWWWAANEISTLTITVPNETPRQRDQLLDAIVYFVTMVMK